MTHMLPAYMARSRPEGVTLSRYNNFVIINLKPLDETQQKEAIKQQLKVWAPAHLEPLPFPKS